MAATDEFNTTPVLIDQTKKIKIPNEFINQNWKLITPSKNEIKIVPNYEEEQLEIKPTSELGSYDLYVDDEYFTSFSTRLSDFESPQIRADFNKLFDSFGKSQISILKDNIIEVIKAQRFGQSLWRFFLIIAVSLLLIESIISRPQKINKP